MSNSLDLRADFPILQRRIDGKPIVYLDSGATSQKPNQVIDAMTNYYQNSNANIHRGVYQLAQEATDLFENARRSIAEFCGSSYETTIFTSNATEAINLAAYSWGSENIGRGDVILISEMEHHANIVPWQLLATKSGAELRYLKIDQEGLLDPQELTDQLATGRVKLLALTHVSNVLGTVNPVKEITAQAKRHGATVLIDGSQAVPHMPVNHDDIGADFYVWTGHKVLGPTGIGVLHGRQELLERMPPFLTGGDMIKTVDLFTSTWNDLPWKFEAGTSMIAEAIGLGAAIGYLKQIGMERVHQHEQALTELALQQLAAVKGVSVVGPPSAKQRGALVSFEIDGIHPHDVAELLNRHNVCVRAGHHCAQPLMRRLGVAATTRASFGPYNVADDVNKLTEAIVEAKEIFRLN